MPRNVVHCPHSKHRKSLTVNQLRPRAARRSVRRQGTEDIKEWTGSKINKVVRITVKQMSMA